MTELIIGIGVFAALIIFYWCCKRDDTPQNTIKEQTPGDIFHALGAVLHGDEEDEDGSRHTYLVEYQGGIFMFVFHKDSPWVFLRFYEFKECGYEHLHKALEAANNINTTQGAWNCGLSKKESDTDGTPILTANLEYLFSCVGNLEQMKGELQVLLGGAFSLARDFSDELDKAIKEGKVKGETRFVTTRFGNVLGSNGSVIPLFKEQIKNGGPITVTHPDIIRFFMLIPEACKLVLEAGTMGQGGEIYVFDMGKPVRIVDLAKRMIKLSGAKDIEIKFTGLRDGEKLYEEVLNDAELTKPTYHPKIKIAAVREYDYEEVKKNEDRLHEASFSYDDMAIVRIMKEIVPEFKSQHSKYEELDGK